MELQGHRGARGVLPENSLPGFRTAVEAGVDCLELDIAMTRDTELVITHDIALSPDIARQDGSWIAQPIPIKQLTAAELRTYNIGCLKPGTAYAQQLPSQQPIKNLRIPTLSELFELPELQIPSNLLLDIEIKTTPLDADITFPPAVIADALLQLIDKHGLQSRARIRSFDWRGLIHISQVSPAFPLAFLTGNHLNVNSIPPGPNPWLGDLDIRDFGGSVPHTIKHLGGQFWAPYYQDLNEAKLASAHELGLQVIVWTVNDAADMRRMIKMGVDGITTDYPALGRRVIDEMTA